MRFALLQLLALGKTPFKRFLKVLAPLSILPLGLFVLNLLFSQSIESEKIFRFLFLSIRENALLRAVVLALRSLSLIVISISYLLAADPMELVNALMQQLSLPPRIGFSIYVAWNTVPFLRQELRRIDYTHKIRMKGKKRSIKQALPTAVALLVGAIRHAERASLSMTARGLEKSRERTFYTVNRWKIRDTAYLIASVCAIASITIVLINTDLFVFGLG